MTCSGKDTYIACLFIHDRCKKNLYPDILYPFKNDVDTKLLALFLPDTEWVAIPLEV